MSLTPADIDRLANLARLGLQPDERARLCVQLNDFFDIVEKMRAVDTAGLVPLARGVAYTASKHAAVGFHEALSSHRWR